jgi:hypothetical protein
MAKVLCVLYPAPESGYPPKCAREGIPALDHYPEARPCPLLRRSTSQRRRNSQSRAEADRTLNLRTCTADRDVPRESREKQ